MSEPKQTCGIGLARAVAAAFILVLGPGRVAGAAAAPPAALTVVLTPPPYYVGSMISATIVVPGSRLPDQIDLTPIRDFEAEIFDAGPWPASTPRPGYVFRLNLIPTTAGTLRLPALRLAGPAGRWITKPLAVEVRAPEPAADMSLVATLSESKCYVGQPITLEVAWTFAGNISEIHAVDLRIPLLENADFKSRDFSTLPKDFGTPIGLPVDNTRMIGGGAYRTIRFRKIIVPQRPGAYTLPAATLLCSVVREPKRRFSPIVGVLEDDMGGFSYPAYFDNQFFSDAGDAAARRFYVRSAALKIRVLPLPDAGKPADFSGIVGPFALSAAIAPSTVHEDEPFTLTLRASGYAYPEVLDLPRLGILPGFKERFRIPAERAAPVMERTDGGDEAVFRQSLRPFSTGVDGVPPVVISFFDPVTATYRVAATAKIPLRVLPGSVANGFDAVFSDGSRPKNVLVANETGIGPNFTESEMLRPPILTWTDRAGFWWLALGLPPALYALVVSATRRERCRRHNPKRERMLWAYRDFLRSTRHLDDPAGLTDAVRAYLGRRLEIGMVTFGSVEGTLRARGVAAREMALLRDLLADDDRRNYSGGPLPPDSALPTNEAARGLVRSIESAFRGPGAPAAPRPLWALAAAGLWLAGAGGTPVAPVPPAEVLSEAKALFQAGMNRPADDAAAAADDFRKAAAAYEYLLTAADSRLDRGKLHYNAGAARFFAGDLGRAIFHFRMAQRARPDDRRIREALAYARAQRLDAATAPPIQRLAHLLPFWRDAVGPGWQKLLFAGAWALFWAGLAAAAFWPSPWFRRLLPGPLLVAGALGVLLMMDAFGYRSRCEGVIVDSEIVARQGPASVYGPAFQSALHAGTEFRVTGRADGWLKIAIPGTGDPCWIPSTSAVLLDGASATGAGRPRRVP